METGSCVDAVGEGEGEGEGDLSGKVDVLWVVDNSAGMCESQVRLREALWRFPAKLHELGLDFRLAVITTDLEDPLESGRFQNIPDFDGGVTCDHVIDPGCPSPENGETYAPLVIRSDDLQYRGLSGELDIDKLQLHFVCNASTGLRGSGFEMGLEAAKTALSSHLLNGHNSNFLRDDALLAVIFVSDDNDCSDRGALDKVNGDICEWEADRLAPVSDYVEFLSELKGSRGMVVVAGIIGPDDLLRYDYGESRAPSCTSDTTSANSGYRYEELIAAFHDGDPWCHRAGEACVAASVCEPSFGLALEGFVVAISEASEL